MSMPTTRRATHAPPQNKMVEGLRGFVRSTYLRATLAGLDMGEHVLLMVDTSTDLGRALAALGRRQPDGGPDEVLLYLASREAFIDALLRLGVDPLRGREALSEPIDLGSVRLVCVGDDLAFFDVVAAEGVA